MNFIIFVEPRPKTHTQSSVEQISVSGEISECHTERDSGPAQTIASQATSLRPYGPEELQTKRYDLTGSRGGVFEVTEQSERFVVTVGPVKIVVTEAETTVEIRTNKSGEVKLVQEGVVSGPSQATSALDDTPLQFLGGGRPTVH